MPAPQIIHDLVAQFEANRSAYRSGKYNEAQLRQEFLNPFFEALGWDIYNKNRFSPEYRDVVVEDSLEIEGSAKAPDYAFKIGPVRKFYVEAKKPAVDIKYDIHPAYQLRRYAWNAHLPLSILTDFEEFAVYNCKNKPDPKDSAATARDLFYRYTDYIEKWDEIAAIFSRDAVWQGSFDRFAETSKGKKGTTEVDDAFLQDIEAWRTLLARNIALRNPQVMDEHQLNYAVQMTIDRIIFLRICEDRLIEPENLLLDLTRAPGIYSHLVEVFQRADLKYNSGLFHFTQEKGQTSPVDTFTPALTIDDKVLKEIISSMYYPCPYIFKEIPVEILGQVYEQFLGKVIRLTSGHQAKIEEKPEVRKAGGVYYTPRYIVDYIVENTVGKLLEGKTPEEAAALKIVDPACGSGSFLLGAYQYLLDWHIDWYIHNDPEKWAKGKDPAIIPASGGGWQLTTQKKKDILVNNIHGVDIDAQAVEVTKLSLLLKVLEGESGQLSLGLERALPDLSRNIQCGNSLIGEDYFAGRLVVDEEERRRVNPFEWQHAFPQVFARGGFDAVIGNPPYRRELDYGELLSEIANTEFGRKYKTPRMDLWYYFVHRGLELLRLNGRLSFIVNSYWTSGLGAEKLINSLYRDTQIEEVFSLGKLKVFEHVSGQHMIIRVCKTDKQKNTIIKIPISENEKSAEPFVLGNAQVSVFEKSKDQLFKENKIDLQPQSGHLLEKIENNPRLDYYGFIRQGIAENPSNVNYKTNEKFDNKFTVNEGVFVLTESELLSLSLPKNEMQLIRPYHVLSDLDRYFISKIPSRFLIYSTKNTCSNINKFPTIRDHLRRFKIIMDERRETKNGSNSWWHLHWPRDENIWKAEKIISIQMASRPSFTYSEGSVYVPFSVNVFIGNENLSISLKYILGLLNSKLLWNWFNHYAKRRGVGLEINGNVLAKAPIHNIDIKNNQEIAAYEMMIGLVERMLDLNMRTPATPQEQESLQRQIAATDRQIDQLVYQLYGLTEEEIRIVEGQ